MAKAGRRRKPTARQSKDEETYGQLRSLLEDLGWTVTVSRTLDGRGGDCIVRGRRRVILAGRLRTVDRIEVLAEALSREELEGRSLPAALEALLERRREGAPRRDGGTAGEGSRG